MLSLYRRSPILGLRRMLYTSLAAVSLAPISATAQIVQIISSTPSGNFGGHNSYDLWINQDGRYAGFVSQANDLVANPGYVPQAYIRDTCVGASSGCTPATTTASLTVGGQTLPYGLQSANDSGIVSATGRYLLFTAESADVIGTPSAYASVSFIRDTCAGVSSGCVPTTFRAARLGAGTVDIVTAVAGDSYVSMTSDGRYVAYATTDQVLTAIPASSTPQVYLTDNCLNGEISGCTPSTILISSVSGTASTEGAFFAAVADGGRYVSFRSSDPALVPGATITQNHYFLRDTCVGAPSGCTPSTSLIDIGADGVSEATGNANDFLADQPVSFSSSGRYILFMSVANNLVAGLTPPPGNQVYLRDTCNGAPSGCTPSTQLVSATDGVLSFPGRAFTGQRSLSDDGRFAVFVVIQQNNLFAVYMRDTCIGAPAGCTPSTQLVSSDPSNIAGADASFDFPVLSGDGKYVAFEGGGSSFNHSQLFLAKAPEFTVSGPAVTLSTSTLDFGAVTIGQTSAPKQVTVKNSGATSLSITNIAVSGTNADEFSQTNDCPTSLAASATCTITVLFAPSAAGSAGATLTLSDNATDSPQSVTLTGSGSASTQLTVTPTSIDFGSAAVGSSTAKSITLSNPGPTTLAISAITIGGSQSTNFGYTSTCSASLDAGKSCTLSLTFHPLIDGALSATLTIVDAVGNISVPLTGTSVASVPQASLSPASFDFGSHAVSDSNAAHTFTLSNTGTTDLAITSVTITGDGAAAFAATGQCGNSLAAGTSCSISVAFAPQAAGSFTAALAVSDSAGTQTASLTGVATAPAQPADFTLSATPTVQNVRRGQSAQFTLHALSTASGNQTIQPVTLSAVNVPQGITVKFSPETVTPGTTAAADSQVTVTIAPNAVFADAHPSRSRFPGAPVAICGFLILVPLIRKKRVSGIFLVVLVGLGCALSITACGSNVTSSQTITIVGTSQGVSKQVPLSITVR